MVAVIAIDQLIKIYIKTHFYLHETVEVTSWFYLTFIENNGMAYGMEIMSKILLTAFRILAVGFFGWMLAGVIRRHRVPVGFVVFAAMIIAGALGNIIDCVFYGRWFTDSYGHVAQWAHVAGVEGYEGWMKGKVVDMFYFPLITFHWPDWMPVAHQPVTWLGMTFDWPTWAPSSARQFVFFSPVFNFADAAISVGVAALVLFYRQTFECLMGEQKEEAAAEEGQTK